MKEVEIKLENSYMLDKIKKHTKIDDDAEAILKCIELAYLFIFD